MTKLMQSNNCLNNRHTMRAYTAFMQGNHFCIALELGKFNLAQYLEKQP
jgi:hypothetical protein